jgi:hypothetical protein
MGKTPPDLMELIASRDALHDLNLHLLEITGPIPKRFARQALGVAIALEQARSEIHALVSAMIEEQQLALAEKRDSWSWDGVQAAHEASQDAERAQPWTEVVNGHYVIALEEIWEQFSSDVDEYLRA